MLQGDIFFSHINKFFKEIISVFQIIDDLKVQEEEETRHGVDLSEACDVMKYNGLVFNPSKCIIGAPVTYFRYVLGKVGIKADSCKLIAINDVPYQQNERSYRVS